MKISCCSESEIQSLFFTLENKHKEYEQFAEAAGLIFEATSSLNLPKLRDLLLQNKRCSKDFTLSDKLIKIATGLKARIPNRLKELRKYLEFVQKYYERVACSFCDFNLLPKYQIVFSNHFKRIKYEYHMHNCEFVSGQLFKMLPFAGDILAVYNLARIIDCIGEKRDNKLRLDPIREDAIYNGARILSHCQKLTPQQLETSSECIMLCQDAFTINSFADPMMSLDKISSIYGVFAANKELIDLVHIDGKKRRKKMAGARKGIQKTQPSSAAPAKLDPDFAFPKNVQQVQTKNDKSQTDVNILDVTLSYTGLIFASHPLTAAFHAALFLLTLLQAT